MAQCPVAQAPEYLVMGFGCVDQRGSREFKLVLAERVLQGWQEEFKFSFDRLALLAGGKVVFQLQRLCFGEVAQ